MSALIFRLRNVPDDEAQDVRDLLDTHNLQWFETTAGNWGIAMPGLWVVEKSDQQRARELIESYQTDRRNRLNRERDERREAGLEPNMLDRLRDRPVASLGIIVFCAFLVYVMVWPFLRLISASSN